MLRLSFNPLTENNMFKKIYILIMIVGLLAGCTDNFEEINTDPNRPKEITPGVMLGQLQYRIVNSSVTAARSLTHELMQVDAPRSSTSGAGIHRYVISPGAGVWNNFRSEERRVGEEGRC